MTGELRIKVQESGVGIAPEDHPKLFTRFGKLHRTASMNNKGVGLGLTIVKHIVESNGGRIIVHSKGVNMGSCFTFTMKMSKHVRQEEESPNHINYDQESVVSSQPE